MIKNSDLKICFSVMTVLTILVGLFQSWGIALSMLNLCLISSVMAMGVNIQWGFAGLINFGVMGFLAIGGLATVLISVPPVPEAWSAGGVGILVSGLFLLAVVFSVLIINKKLPSHKFKNYFNFCDHNDLNKLITSKNKKINKYNFYFKKKYRNNWQKLFNSF